MEKERKNTRRNKGITLISLVITIIILLILAGISIAELTGTGIFAKAEEAKQKYKDAEELENQILADYESQLNSLGKSTVGSGDGTGGGDGEDDGGGEQNDPPTPSNPDEPAESMAEAKSDDMFEKTVNSTVKDEYDNQVVVPAGFKITNDANNVTEGIVIKDKDENEFVWIPVGDVKNKEQTKTIELNRYIFNSEGIPTKQNETQINDGSHQYEEVSSAVSTKNAKAKDINAFKTSVGKNHGYYIGRYEARTVTNHSTSDKLTPVTEKGSEYVYSNIDQSDASKLCQEMYQDKTTFTSDLMNSYAWDTAIFFLQTFDNRDESKKTTPYSRQRSLNTINKADKGTNKLDDISQHDLICNIYDMASNACEWTTEYTNDTWTSCTLRGGDYKNNGYTSYRSYRSI